MALATDSGCINHPGFEAVARCKQCGKPVCGKCVVSAPTGNFCGTVCREKYDEFAKRAATLEQSRKGSGLSNLFRKLRRFVLKTIIWLVVILGALFVLSYFGVHVPVIGNLMRQFTGQ